MRPISRSYSDKYIPGQSEYDLHTNKNAEWFSTTGVKFFYVVIVLLVWAALHVSSFFDFNDCWTLTNMIHGAVSYTALSLCAELLIIDYQVTFVIFHWIKGNPDDSSQGEYNALTLYEQIDAGTAWTTSKKFLMLVPTLLTWIACYAADFKPFYIIVNLGIFLICIIAKIPQMHGVRILGINSTPGIDTPVEIADITSPYKSKKSK